MPTINHHQLVSESVASTASPGALARMARPSLPMTATPKWYAGPDNFGYHRMTEFTGGLNYYLHGHNAKAQLAYSCLRGSTFALQDFGADRFILQTQIAF